MPSEDKASALSFALTIQIMLDTHTKRCILYNLITELLRHGQNTELLRRDGQTAYQVYT